MDNLKKPPFPWFGGKSKVAHVVWNALGNVNCYVEPFAGSLAVLLHRPHTPNIEIVNDIDSYLANFWRAISNEPEQVAYWADWPKNETDHHARHIWLLGQSEFREKMISDPDFYDVKIAGWWVWGQSMRIGRGWCEAKKHYKSGEEPLVPSRSIPELDHGRGIHRKSTRNLVEYFSSYKERMRLVNVTCGDWKRVSKNSVIDRQGLTGVFLDPPYDLKGRYSVYANETNVLDEVREWALENGKKPLLRIALCGYDTEHTQLTEAGWTTYRWTASGGYARKTHHLKGKENAKRETIWLSPHCLQIDLRGSK